MLRDHALAEDAAQEVFIKVYQSLAKFRRESAFSTWLYRVTANHCKDVLRKVIRRKAESLEALREEHGDKLDAELAVPVKEPNAENSELIFEVMEKLPEETRSILILREVQGLSYQEISETLECSLDAVKSRLRRARQELILKVRHFLKTQSV